MHLLEKNWFSFMMDKGLKVIFCWGFSRKKIFKLISKYSECIRTYSTVGFRDDSLKLQGK